MEDGEISHSQDGNTTPDKTTSTPTEPKLSVSNMVAELHQWDPGWFTINSLSTFDADTISRLYYREKSKQEPKDLQAEAEKMEEIRKQYPISVSYSREKNPSLHLFTVDEQALQQVLSDMDYKPFPGQKRELTIFDTNTNMFLQSMTSLPGTKNMLFNEATFIDFVRTVRQRGQDALEGIEPGKWEKYLQPLRILGNLLNPTKAAYLFLRNQGKIPFYRGNQERHQQYIDAAKKGFVTMQDGQKVEHSPEESIVRAKEYLDTLLEKAAPSMIGWYLAHTFERRRNAMRKGALKVGLTVLPGIVLHPLAPLGAVGSAFGTYLNESEAYAVADGHWEQFAKAITINHDVFIKKVLTDTPERKLQEENIEIGEKTIKQLEQELLQNSISLFRIDRIYQATLSEHETLDIIMVKPTDLGIDQETTTAEIYKQAKNCGLEPVPIETTAYYLLKYPSQLPTSEDIAVLPRDSKDLKNMWAYIHNPEREDDSMRLSFFENASTETWHPDTLFMFSIRKPETKNT